MRPVAFLPHLSMGLAFSPIRTELVGLLSGRSLREAKIRHLRIGPLHKVLKKGGENLVG
jgi:hypothetical protein